MRKSKKLILFGTGDLGRIAYEYFDRHTEYEVVAFTVDREYFTETTMMGLPVIPFDGITSSYPPHGCSMHVCIVYDKLNRNRAFKCQQAKSMGYRLASYISPHAFVAPTAVIGEHCFIFENNVIQDYVEIGDNCILWSGNHVGHDTKIDKDVFVSSHVVISGHCHIGSNVFIGVNSTLANNTVIGKESWVSHASVLSGVIPPNAFVKSVQSEAVPLNEEALFRSLKRARR